MSDTHGSIETRPPIVASVMEAIEGRRPPGEPPVAAPVARMRTFVEWTVGEMLAVLEANGTPTSPGLDAEITRAVTDAAIVLVRAVLRHRAGAHP